MAIKEHPMQALEAYLPNGSFEKLLNYINQYRIHLTITKQRKSVLGDYRHSGLFGANHRISVNGNLNKYEFLITFLHELAHLLVYDQYRNKVEAHGKEWKLTYRNLLIDFVSLGIFPLDIEQALHQSMRNPAATASGETDLLNILRKYNPIQKIGYALVSEIPEGTLFETENGKIFKRGALRRKRIICEELKTKLQYTFSPITEVKIK